MKFKAAIEYEVVTFTGFTPQKEDMFNVEYRIACIEEFIHGKCFDVFPRWLEREIFANNLTVNKDNTSLSFTNQDSFHSITIKKNNILLFNLVNCEVDRVGNRAIIMKNYEVIE